MLADKEQTVKTGDSSFADKSILMTAVQSYWWWNNAIFERYKALSHAENIIEDVGPAVYSLLCVTKHTVLLTGYNYVWENKTY